MLHFLLLCNTFLFFICFLLLPNLTTRRTFVRRRASLRLGLKLPKNFFYPLKKGAVKKSRFFTAPFIFHIVKHCKRRVFYMYFNVFRLKLLPCKPSEFTAFIDGG